MGWDNQGKPEVLRPFDDQGNIIFCDSNFEDTWKEMEIAVELGLVKSIGVSNFNKKQVQRILDICKIKPVTNQEKFQIRPVDWSSDGLSDKNDVSDCYQRFKMSPT